MWKLTHIETIAEDCSLKKTEQDVLSSIQNFSLKKKLDK